MPLPRSPPPRSPLSLLPSRLSLSPPSLPAPSLSALSSSPASLLPYSPPFPHLSLLSSSASPQSPFPSSLSSFPSPFHPLLPRPPSRMITKGATGRAVKAAWQSERREGWAKQADRADTKMNGRLIVLDFMRFARSQDGISPA